MRNMSMRLGVGLVAVVLIGSLQVPSLAADRATPPSKASPAPATPVKRVRIVNYAFDPVTITITKGTRVRWTNAGSVNHTSTSNKGVWSSGSIAPGDTFGRLFKKVGTFRYHCTIHPTQMRGKIVVT